MREADQRAPTLAGLAAAIRAGTLTAEALARDTLARCAAGRRLKAIISQDPDRLLAAARAADARRSAGQPLGLLHGVPVLVKDNIDTVDYPTSAGTPALAQDYPRADAGAVERLRGAGALVAGKANLFELAVGGNGENLTFGRVGNPWRLDFVPGGSSSGSAAAVAARLVPAALGTDTNGSVRGPCAQCGIAGFRPSFQRYPGSGIIPPTPTRDSVGTLATTVADLVLLDQVLAGERYELEPLSLAGLRFGRPREHFCELLDERVATVVSRAVALLEAAGAVIVEADIPGLASLTQAAAWPISGYEVIRDMPAYLARRGTPLSIDAIMAGIASPVARQRFTPRARDEAGRQRLATAYEVAMREHRPRLQRTLQDYFDNHRLDAMLFPTTPFPALPYAADDADVTINGRVVPNGFGRLIHNTVHQSAAGIPSLVVPAGLTADGLPVGLSFDAPAGADRRLLAIGLAFEAARGTFPAPAGWPA